jgi:hypothetical protein
MAIWQNVNGYANGDKLRADVLNRPISELTARTDYLHNLLKSLLSDEGRQSITFEVELTSDDTPDIGDVVCIDTSTGLYKKAIASMSLYDSFTASVQAYAIGILVEKSNLSGLITIYGHINTSHWVMANCLDYGSFESGQYYLSSTKPGKITRFPNGPRISIGFFSKSAQKNGDYSGTQAFINPQYMDIEAHTHRTYTLLARPCGMAEVTDATVKVTGYLPDTVGSNTSIQNLPRLVVHGDWTSEFSETYSISISNASGETPTAWPCILTWNRITTDNTNSDTAGDTGTAQIRFFGDSVPVGKYGLRVRLEKSDLMDEATPFGNLDLTLEERTWTVNRKSGRGWSSASVNVALPVDGTDSIIRITGVSNKFINRIVFQVPNKVYDLTKLPMLSEGDKLVLDDTTYTFTHKVDNQDPNAIQIIDTVAGSNFDTLAQICSTESSAIYDEDIRQVLIGCESVKFNEESLTPDFNNLDSSTKVAFISYDTGESLANGVTVVGGSTTFSVINCSSSFEAFPLNNGFSIMLTSGIDTIDEPVYSTIYSVPGASFRYNIEFDNDFKLHFPPVPAKSGSFMLNGVEVETYTHYGNSAVLAIGDDTLYWRDDSLGRQPWPVPNMKQTDSVDAEDEYREVFHFVSEFHSETGPVTSIRPAEDSPVVIRRCSTDENATVGDLEIDVNLMLGMSDQNTPGYKVPKAARGNKLLLGPVVEKLIPGPGITFSRKAGMPEGQGIFTISADGSTYAGDFETIALENAKLESISMFPYTRLLGWDPESNSNINTGFVAKFHIPATTSNAIYRVKFYASVFGESSFKASNPLNAGIKLDYSILPDYTTVDAGIINNANLKTGLIQPDKSTVLNIPFGALDEDGSSFSYTAFDPILIHNDPTLDTVLGKNVRVLDYTIPSNNDCTKYITTNNITGVFGVRPGYTVAIRFSRAAPTEGAPYIGSVGFLNLRWSIEEVTTIDTKDSVPTNIDDIVVQTVTNLRAAASKAGRMNTSYEIVDILTRIVNALK